MSETDAIPDARDPAQSLLRFLLPAFAFSLPFSIALAQFFAFSALAVWAVALARRKLPRGPCNPYVAPVLLFVLVAVVASVCGWRPHVSLPKLHRLLLFLLIFAIPSVAPRRGEARLDFAVLLVGAFIAGTTFRAVYDSIHIPLALLHVPPGSSTWFWLFSQGDMRTPQFYMVALCFLVAAVATDWARRHPAFLGLLLALNAAGLVVHFKRGVWFAFGGAVVVMCLAARRWRPLLVLAGCAALLALLPPVQARLRAAQDEWTGAKPGSRVQLWRRAAPGLLQRAWPLGMGLSAMNNTDLRHYVRDIEPKLNHLHNNVLQVAVELGVAGLAVWCGWMLQALILFLRPVRRLAGSPAAGAWLAAGALGGFCGLLFNGMVEYNFGTGLILMLFGMMMGLSVVLNRAAAAPPGGPA